jgi:hypothetical protein
VLLAVLVGAFLAGMNWLIHAAPGPTASPTQVPTPAPTSAPAPAAQPTIAPTANPTLRPTVAPTATAAPTITPAPTVVPTVEPTVAAALNTDWWDWSSDQIDASEAQEVLAGVDANWANITDAWRTLNPVRLGDTETEPALGDLTGILQERRAESRAQKVDVQRSDTTVHYLGDGLAVVYETYLENSVAVDLSSGKPLEPPPNQQHAVSYLLVKADGTYKVAQIAHHDVQASQ